MLRQCPIDVLICDFDGVLTDNFVYVDEAGMESVRCSRSDGMAIEALVSIGIPVFIMSREKNAVVNVRAQKLRVEVLQAVNDKATALNSLATKRGFCLTRTAFVGNDLNDLRAMALCGLRACPSDAHEQVAAMCTHRLNTAGGFGVVRELVEKVLEVDIAKAIDMGRS